MSGTRESEYYREYLADERDDDQKGRRGAGGCEGRGAVLLID